MKKIHAMIAILAVLALALSSCSSAPPSGAVMKNTTESTNQSSATSYDKALEQAKSAVSKNANDADAHFQLGVSLSNNDDMAGAYREFVTAGKLDPKKVADAERYIKANWSKHYDSGMNEFQTGDARGAAHEWELATKADPRQVKAWLNLAKVYYGLVDADSTFLPKTYAAVDSILAKNNNKKDPSYSGALGFEGRILARQGRTAEATKAFDEFLSLEPGEYKIAEEAAVGYLNKKDWKSGADLLQLVVVAEQNTKNEAFQSYFNLGVAYLNLKNYPKAIDALNDAMRLDAGSKKGLYYLLLANYQGNQFDDAIFAGQQYT
ncbi:MAG TPA: tetratricopeptide repeat protein, partial [Candidatus Bathyarchaeia archaeon]|nr:tetratricopeptide repeat protein [Candidatus Bathyarchaeia archaeon]